MVKKMTKSIFMPQWAEPQRHTVVCSCVCVCVSGAKSRKSLKTKHWYLQCKYNSTFNDDQICQIFDLRLCFRVMPSYAHLDGRYGRSGVYRSKTCTQQTSMKLDGSIYTTGQPVTQVKSSVTEPITAFHLCSSTLQARPAVIMPQGAEPRRHTVVIVCVYVFHAHFSATAKN